MQPKSDIEAIEGATVELQYIFDDSVKYPQLRMPDRQQERVKNLLFDLRAYLNKRGQRAKP